MNELLHTLDQNSKYKQQDKTANKSAIENYASRQLKLEKKRSVYKGKGFALRFSEVRGKTKGFSNVVLSLSPLLEYDSFPFVVCVIRDNRIDFLLANTTFLKKINHSSHRLRTDNIKGGFLGQDIVTNYNEILNIKSNISQLFAFHSKTNLQQNIERLVEATTSIKAIGNIFEPTPLQIRNILQAPSLFVSTLQSDEYRALEKNFLEKTESLSQKILEAATDNIFFLTNANVAEVIAWKKTNPPRPLRKIEIKSSRNPAFNRKREILIRKLILDLSRYPWTEPSA